MVWLALTVGCRREEEARRAAERINVKLEKVDFHNLLIFSVLEVKH